MIGGAWCAQEGKANPLKATPAFARAARRLGATLLPMTEVLGLEAEPGGWLATTSAGPIRAGRVVDAAGADAGRIAAMVGVSLPIDGYPLQVAVTEPIAPLVPHLLYSAAGKLTLKQMRNGTCLIGGGWPSRLRSDGRLATDPRSLAANMGTALAVVPALAGARIARTWPAIVNGTPDWNPIIREVPGRKDFFVSLFPWMGFTAGPITARMTSDLVLGR
jgi:glycine/D-amino acid oxidase-like deaminating enzyme